MREQLADMTHNSLLIISGLILVLLVTAMGLYVVKPAYKDWSQIKESYTVLSSALTVDIDLSADIDFMEQNRDRIAELLQSDSASLQYKQVESHVIGRLQKLAWDNNLRLAGVKPDMGRKIGEFRELLFSVGLTGDYFDIYNMLHELKENLEFVVVQEMRMKPESRNNEDQLLAIEMTIASYRVETDD